MSVKGARVRLLGVRIGGMGTCQAGQGRTPMQGQRCPSDP